MDPELLRALLGDMVGFPEPTADSIFTAVAPPANPIKINHDLGFTIAAEFDHVGRQIAFNPVHMAVNRARARGNAEGQGRSVDDAQALMESRVPGQMVHELFHQQTITSDGQVEGADSDFQGLLSLMRQRLVDATPDQRREVYREYYGRNPVNQLGLRADPRASNIDNFAEGEMLASVFEGAFSLARAANQAPHVDIKDLLDKEDERLPGTREAFNFLVRRFPR